MTELLELQDVTQRHHAGNSDDGNEPVSVVRASTADTESTGGGVHDDTPPELYNYEARSQRKTVIVGTLIVALLLLSFIIMFVVAGRSV